MSLALLTAFSQQHLSNSVTGKEQNMQPELFIVLEAFPYHGGSVSWLGARKTAVLLLCCCVETP